MSFDFVRLLGSCHIGATPHTDPPSTALLDYSSLPMPSRISSCVYCVVASRCICCKGNVPWLFYRRLFSNLVYFSAHLPVPPLLEMSPRQHEPPHTRRAGAVCFASLAPDSRESNLLLTKVSAAMSVSSVGGVMLLKGFACIFRGRLKAGGGGEYSGMSYVPSWHERKWRAAALFSLQLHLSHDEQGSHVSHVVIFFQMW